MPGHTTKERKKTQKKISKKIRKLKAEDKVNVRTSGHIDHGPASDTGDWFDTFNKEVDKRFAENLERSGLLDRRFNVKDK